MGGERLQPRTWRLPCTCADGGAAGLYGDEGESAKTRWQCGLAEWPRPQTQKLVSWHANSPSSPPQILPKKQLWKGSNAERNK